MAIPLGGNPKKRKLPLTTLGGGAAGDHARDNEAAKGGRQVEYSGITPAGGLTLNAMTAALAGLTGTKPGDIVTVDGPIGGTIGGHRPGGRNRDRSGTRPGRGTRGRGSGGGRGGSK